jgi:hypothetical protein
MLDTLPYADLLAIHNALAEKPARRFDTQASGGRRTAALMEERGLTLEQAAGLADVVLSDGGSDDTGPTSATEGGADTTGTSAASRGPDNDANESILVGASDWRRNKLRSAPSPPPRAGRWSRSFLRHRQRQRRPP